LGFGTSPIPVLEYKQMAGRAGRPRFDPYGEAIVIAKNENEVNQVLDRYIRAETEEIYSKLGTEPALRSHLLAFIAADYVDSFETALKMIAQTFYGFQNEGSLFLVEEEVNKVLDLLIEAKLITPKEPYQVTPFGKRTTELYLDPLSARLIKKGLENTVENANIPEIAYLQMLTSTPDVRTYSLRQKDMGVLFDIAEEYADEWFETDLDTLSEYDYDLFFTTLKTAFAVQSWLSESSEEKIFQKLALTSGDLHSILSTTQWMLHCAVEFSKIFKWKNHRKNLDTMLKRVQYGIKTELLKLVQISGIGRVRARSLFDAGYRTIDSILEAHTTDLAKLAGFGPQLAQNLKKALTDGTELDVDSTEVEFTGEVQETLTTYFDD
jgi:helicase